MTKRVTAAPEGFRPWSGEETLDRALVAGLLLEVILDHPGLPADPQARRCQVRARLKTTLVTRLAGHIPLNSFRTLARNLDAWFDFFYPLIAGDGLDAAAPRDFPAFAPPGALVQAELLADFLIRIESLLPKRRHRKLDREKLAAFLTHTQGEWFRLRDFEQYFAIDRKTAWEYVQKFLQAGLLTHNQGRSAAARYRLAPRFVSG